jgi:hypothetical protein
LVLWRRNSGKHRQRRGDEPSAIDPLKSKADAETFGMADGVGQAIGADPTVTGAAALYAKAEQVRRRAEETGREATCSGDASRPSSGPTSRPFLKRSAAWDAATRCLL